jgi:hypothetical protein
VTTRQTLLPTSPERVPHEFAQTVIDFCKPVDAIAAGYVGLIRVVEDFNYPVEQLAAAFELVQDEESELELVAERFYESMPADVQAGGCNILEPGGATVWRERAQRVFSRSPASSP